MPIRRASRAPDLDRVRQVLAPTGSGHASPVRWVPPAPPAETRGSVSSLGSGPDELDRLDDDLRRSRRPALLTVPEPLRRGRLSVSGGTVVALLALVVGLGCVFALRVLWAERSSEPVAAAGTTASSTGVVVSGSSPSAPLPGQPTSTVAVVGAEAAAHGGPTAATELVVHVVGQVRRPGLVRLRPGARVADAITAAGGARTGADLTALNLARPVVDGEQVHVPKPGEVLSSPLGPPTTPSASAGTASVVDLNTADAAALDTLPGVGPVLAQRIIDWRSEHGRFSSVDELGEVSGIGDKLMSQLRPRVRV